MISRGERAGRRGGGGVQGWKMELTPSSDQRLQIVHTPLQVEDSRPLNTEFAFCIDTESSGGMVAVLWEFKMWVVEERDGRRICVCGFEERKRGERGDETLKTHKM